MILNGPGCSCSNGLNLQGANITVRGLAIHSYPNNGIFISGAGAVIQGNYFGTDPGGMTSFPNGLSGVSGTSNGRAHRRAEPAGPQPDHRLQRVRQLDRRHGVTYQNNLIGGDRATTGNVRNQAEGLFLTSGNNIVVAGNRISFNDLAGVELSGTANATVDGNFIQLNGGPGVRVLTDSNDVINNTIAGNTGQGITIASNFNDVTSNNIQMGNTDGISIAGSFNDVFTNTILGNNGAGIRVASGVENNLFANTAHSNASAGIIHGTGAGGLPNDEASPPYDTDSGPNGLTNFPVITSAQTMGGTTTFSGTVKTYADSPVRIDFFENDNPQGVGNGQRFIASLSGVSTDVNGLLTFSYTASGLYNNITATSTVDLCSDGCDETSEFSFPSVAATPSAGPALSASPAALAFGPQPVGTFSPTQTSTLTNMGPGDVSFTSFTGSGDFQFFTDCGSILPQGASCFIDAQFHPLATGLRGGAITIVSDAAVSPLSITLSGTGTAGPSPAIALQPDALVFEAVELGSRSEPQAIRLVNSGSGDLNIRGFDTFGDFTILRPDFREQQGRGKTGRKASRIVTTPPYTTCGSVVFAGESCLIVIEFEPTARGPRQGVLIVDSDAPTPSVSARLTGQGGTGPTNALEIASVLDFGEQFFGTRSVGRESSSATSPTSASP